MAFDVSESCHKKLAAALVACALYGLGPDDIREVMALAAKHLAEKEHLKKNLEHRLGFEETFELVVDPHALLALFDEQAYRELFPENCSGRRRS